MHSDPTDLSTWTRRGYVPLAELGGLRMASDEPDVRGWEVLTLDSQPLGHVDDLLVDRDRGEIVAAIVRPAAAAGGTRRLVFPVERLGIVEGRDRTLVAEDAAVDDDASSSAVIDADRERRRAAPAATAAHTEQPRASTGHAAQAAVPPDGITVERTADEEIVRVPVVEERLVVERRPVVTETLVIRKKLMGGRQVVEGDVRRERIEVDRTDLDRTGDGRVDR